MYKKTLFWALLSFVVVNTQAQTTPSQVKLDKSIQKHLDRYTDSLKSNAEELAIIDTATLPDINDELDTFDKSDVNYIYIKRLDSIENEVPLTHNAYVQKYIDIYTGRKSFVSNMLSLGKYYFPIFEEALKENEVPVELKYLPVIESAMNPMATSRVGAKGIWQFMHATGKAYGLTINNYVDERRDPELASKAAATYLKEAYDEFGDWLLAIASYNCGLGNVRRAIAKSGGKNDFWSIRPYLPRETRNYVPAYIAATYAMQCYDKDQIALEADQYFNAEHIYISNSVNLSQLANSLQIEPEKLYLLNPAYSKHIVIANADEPKEIVIPKFACTDRTLVYNALNISAENNPLKITNEPDDRVYRRATSNRKMFVVKVRRGQTLSSIAETYSVPVGMLKSWNGIRKNKVLVGQNLKVYSANASQYAKNNRVSSKKYYSYKVRKGDTLSGIADKRGSSITAIKKLNGIKSNHTLRPGMVLKVDRL